MTTKAEWEKAKAENHAYYPKTFEVDGFYTHATGVPSRLIETANHFYQVIYLSYSSGSENLKKSRPKTLQIN